MDKLKANYRRAVFAWLAMVGCIFFCLLLVDLFKPDVHFLQKSSSCPEVVSLKYFLLTFSALTLFLIWFVRSQILAGNAPGGKTIASRLLTASILTDALCAMMAVNGLTLFLLTRNSICFYIFLFLSLVLFTYFFPRYVQWQEWAGKAEAVKAPVVWVPFHLIPGPEFDQRGAPASGVFSGQPEGSDFRQSAQNRVNHPA